MKRGETNAQLDRAAAITEAVQAHLRALMVGRLCACEGPHTAACLIDDGAGDTLVQRAERRLG